MKHKVTTKFFLPIAATILFVMSLASISSALELNRTGGILPVFIATDIYSINGNTVDQARVQDMVNAVVCGITGMARMCDAWENIFPYNSIDSTTKILIKYNPRTPKTSREAVVNAVKVGLTYMKEYTFPEANIMVIGNEGEATTDTTTDTITIVTDTAGGSLKYLVKDPYVECDFIINLSSSWGADSIGCGVDMALAALMDAVVGVDTATTVEDMYPYFTPDIDTAVTIYPALSVLARHETFFQKQILFLTDCITYSATGDSTDLDKGYRIYGTTNLVVSDFQGILFLDSLAGKLSAEETVQGFKVCSLACVWPYDLGVVNPGQMYINNITVPWITSISVPNSISNSPINLFVNTNSARSIFSYNNSGTPADIVIFNLQGKEIWSQRSSENTITWNNSDRHGQKVPSGMYLYEMKIGETKAQGKTAIRR